MKNSLSHISVLFIAITLGAGSFGQEAEKPKHNYGFVAIGGRGVAPTDVEAARKSMAGMEKRYRTEKMEAIANRWMADLIRGLQEATPDRSGQNLQSGGVSERLAQVLISEESYTGPEAEDAFGPQVKYEGRDQTADLLDKLGDEDAKMVSKEYTLIRKQLRKETLLKLIEKLRKSTDPRVQAMAAAVERAMYDSLRAYDIAIHKIENDPKQRAPVCFTCGEDVAHDNVDPGLHDPKELAKGRKDTKGEDYYFYDAMKTAAKDAMIFARLDIPGDEMAFFNGTFGRTSEGRTVQLAFQDRDYNGQSIPLRPVALTAPGESMDVSAKRAQDPAFLNAVRRYYFDETKANGGKWNPAYTAQQRSHIADFIKKTEAGTPFMKEAEKTALAAVAARQNKKQELELREGKMPLSKEVLAYLTSLNNEPPNADLYPVEKLAETLGLINPVTGKPVFTSRGVGSHAPPHFGVKIDWTELANLNRTHPEHYKQIMERLNDVYNGSVYHYKIVNNHVSSSGAVSADGYCLWCYLRNSPEADGKLTLRR